jgi:hypothetical protein
MYSFICLDIEIQVHLHGRWGIQFHLHGLGESCPLSGAAIQFNLHGFRPDLLGKKWQSLIYTEPPAWTEGIQATGYGHLSGLRDVHAPAWMERGHTHMPGLMISGPAWTDDTGICLD